MTIVKMIVEQCGGSVGVESKGANKGSLFCISMQMNPAESLLHSNMP